MDPDLPESVFASSPVLTDADLSPDGGFPDDFLDSESLAESVPDLLESLSALLSFLTLTSEPLFVPAAFAESLSSPSVFLASAPAAGLSFTCSPPPSPPSLLSSSSDLVFLVASLLESVLAVSFPELEALSVLALSVESLAFSFGSVVLLALASGCLVLESSVVFFTFLLSSWAKLCPLPPKKSTSASKSVLSSSFSAKDCFLLPLVKTGWF